MSERIGFAFLRRSTLGPTLLNMRLTGSMATAYVLPVGGGLPRLDGPWNARDPSTVLAALLGTNLAPIADRRSPIAGRFGWHWGILAGFIHSSVAQSVGDLNGGLVLYNNGFAAGLVASVVTPVVVAVQKTWKARGAETGGR